MHFTIGSHVKDASRLNLNPLHTRVVEIDEWVKRCDKQVRHMCMSLCACALGGLDV